MLLRIHFSFSSAIRRDCDMTMNLLPCKYRPYTYCAGCHIVNDSSVEHPNVCLLFAHKESRHILFLMGVASPVSISSVRAVILKKTNSLQANTSLNLKSKLSNCDCSSSLIISYMEDLFSRLCRLAGTSRRIPWANFQLHYSSPSSSKVLVYVCKSASKNQVCLQGLTPTISHQDIFLM